MKLSWFLAVILLAVPALAGPQAKPSPAPSPGAEGPTPTFPSEVDLVTVDVVVTDKKGVPITGLPREAFSLFEDGNPQAVSSFEAVTVPPAAATVTPTKPRVSTNMAPEARTGRTFAIVFDDIHLMPHQAHRAKAAVGEFLKSGVREGDRVALVATGGGAWWSTRMEAGRDELITLLKRLDGRHIPDMSPDRMSDWEAMRIHMFQDQQVEQRVSRRWETYGVTPGQTGRSEMQMGDSDPLVRGRASEVYFQAAAKNRITLQTLERVLLSLASTKGRKSLILVSEGFIYDPHLDEFKKVVQTSRRSNVALYFLDTRGLGGLPSYMSAQFGPAIDNQDIGAAFMENLEASEGAESLAADTGGFSVKNTNDLAKGVQRIAEESRSYYLLGYNPANQARDGRFRKIQVKVAGKDLRVRYRKGYYAPLDGGKAPERKGGADPDIQAALDSPYEEDAIPMRMTHYVFDETLLGKASVLLVTEVDVDRFGFEEKDGRFQDTLEFLLVAAHRESGEYFRYDQSVVMNLQASTRDRLRATWYPIVRDFELAPGGYQAKLVVRDKNTGRIGTVVHEFEVPDLSQFRVSSLNLSDTLQPNAEGQQGPPRVMMLARRAFPSDATLYGQFEVYGAAKDKKTGMPHVRAGYTIRHRDGGVVAQVAPTVINPTSLGKLSRLVGVPLQNAAPGEYEMVLTFQDEIGGKTLELREPFSVVATATAAAGPAATTAPTAPSDPDLDEGARLVAAGDFQGAVERLDRVLRRLSTAGGATRDLALAHLYMGVAYLGLDQEKAGRASFREALKLDGALTLAPERFPAKAVAAFEAARADAGRP
ncbi:MAG TPA: VWA domain-containing protein [Vicinamibacteria bacterium]|jgi:VWFA-related protein